MEGRLPWALVPLLVTVAPAQATPAEQTSSSSSPHEAQDDHGEAAASTRIPPPDVPAQQGGITWEDLVKSGTKLTIYGFLRLDAYYNTARANSVIIPAVVLPEDGLVAKPNDNQFTLDPRLTRLGIDVEPGEVGGTMVKGKLEVDFANFVSGVPESRATPRIRLAYMDLSKDEWSLRIGQDWDVVSPLYPAVNHELLMWNAGNLGDRRPQIQGAWRPASDGSSQFELRTSLGLTGAINNQDLDPSMPGVSTERDGFDFGLPHVQLRAGYETESLAGNRQMDLGVWGLFGRTEVDVPINGTTRFDIWTAGIDWTIPLNQEFTLRGEAWLGENLGDVRGCIGQTVNTTTGEEIASAGGFAELWYQPSDKLRFHLGSSLDDPENDDLLSGNPKRNLTGYVGTVVDWDSGLRTGFDAIYWETDWVGNGIGNMVRFDLYFQYNF